MSNAKRAIECQIDSIISILGYDYKLFDKRNSYIETKKFINEFFDEDSVDGLTDRIKFLQILNITPTFLISKIRNLRNQVEHEYIIPSYQEVKEAVEITELFIHSSMRKISITNRAICFGSKYKLQKDDLIERNVYSSYQMYPKYISIEINWYPSASFQLTLVRDNSRTMPYDEFSSENSSYNIDASDPMYPYMLKVFYGKEYFLLARILGYEIEKKHIKYIIEDI